MDMIRCLWMPDVVHCRGVRPARQYVTHHAVTTFQTPSRSPDAQVDDVPVPVTELQSNHGRHLVAPIS